MNIIAKNFGKNVRLFTNLKSITVFYNKKRSRITLRLLFISIQQLKLKS